jgi:hypothetical protein
MCLVVMNAVANRDSPLEVCSDDRNTSPIKHIHINHHSVGNYLQFAANLRQSDANASCLPNDLSAFCAKQCLAPALCSRSGLCQCPTATMTMIDINDRLQQTCRCVGHPFITYQNGTCDVSNNESESSEIVLASRSIFICYVQMEHG